MKKYIITIALVILLSFSAVVLANSGPTFWQGHPSSDIMSVEENCPITVKSENLVFDFSDNRDSDYTVSGKVTAAYKMVNPTNEIQTVQMAFPFVESLGSLSSKDITINADGSALPYDVYFGDIVDSRGNPRHEEKEASYEFANIVNTITNAPYKAKNFEKNEKGKLYTIKVRPTTEQRIDFEAVFNFNSNKTRILTNGFNGYYRNNAITRLSAWCYEPRVLEVFVLGDDINLFTNAYTDGEHKEKTELFTCEISTEEIEFNSYLMDSIKKNTRVKNSSIISDTQLYNLYAKGLDRSFTINTGCSSEYDLMAQEEYDRIITLVYTVEFPPNSEKQISVSYKTTGTMDKTKTKEPLYTFDYILNPAENWGDFKDLNIEIIPPKKAPYIVKSSVELTKGEDKAYTAALPSLPDEDLSFTLYADKQITLLDQSIGNLKNNFGYFTPFVIGTPVFLILLTIMIAISKRKKNKY